MRVLVAPDKFKGTLTAEQASRAIATGWRRERPEDVVEEIPLADGGEGTLDTLVAALGGAEEAVRVTGPLGDPVDAAFGLVDGASGRTGVVEMARASGLQLVGEGRRDALRASSRGTGELIMAACRRGATEVLVCLGGSASTDGGAGIAQALGARLLDATGREIGPGGIGLLELDSIDLGSLDPMVRGARMVAATDVDSPLTGPHGAARVFGPQKGASSEDVPVLERALGHLAAVIHRDLALDVRDLRRGGAAGGAGAGLAALLGARLRSGVEVVMEATGFRSCLASADAVLTGEGSFDAQSRSGKVASAVISAAREAGVPVAVLCGRAELELASVLVVSLVDLVGPERALQDTRTALEELAAEVAARAGELSSPV